MLMNGIDYRQRGEALTAAGIDPHGSIVQFRDRLGATYTYCNQHLGVHRTDGSCTVDCIEQFPLKATGDLDDARTECRERGFRLYGEPCPCVHCGETITQPQFAWVTVEGRSSVCPDNKDAYRPGHAPVPNLPAEAATSI